MNGYALNRGLRDIYNIVESAHRPTNLWEKEE